MSLITILINVITFLANTCTCPPLKSLEALQELEFENSECIFVGEVIDENIAESTFIIVVIESFDGDDIGKTYKGSYDNCGPVMEKGKWIIYAEQNSDNDLLINGCGLTRSFDRPENVGVFSYIPSPSMNNTELENFRKYRKDLAAKDLKNEIDWLREKTRY